MVELKKFKGIGYSDELNPLDDYLTLPFDEIDEDLKNKYLKRNPYNFVRINLPDKHDYSLKTINEWIAKKILIMDKEEHIYPYIQKFFFNGRMVERKAFFSLISVDQSFKEIIPHERIFQAPKNERLELMKKVQMDIEPIFFLYNDINGKCSYLLNFSKKILWGEEPNGINNELYVLDDDPDECNKMKFVIADGHHRYSAAVDFSKINEKGKYVMGVFVNVNDPGLIILPSNKIVKNIPNDFNINSFENYFEIEQINSTEKIIGSKEFILVYKNKYYLLRLKDKLNFVNDKYMELGPVIFNDIILNKILKIDYDFDRIITFHNTNLNLENLKNSMAFIFNPVTPKIIWDISLNGKRLPQKSTYFYPKIVSGLRLYKKE